MLFYTYCHFCCFTERKCTDLFALNLAFLWKSEMFVCHLLHFGMWDHFPTYPDIPINQVDGSKWIHMFDLTLILHQMALLPLFHVPKYYIQKITIKSSDKKILDAHCFQSFSVNSVLKTTKINWHAHTTDGSTCLIWHGFCTRWPSYFNPPLFWAWNESLVCDALFSAN